MLILASITFGYVKEKTFFLTALSPLIHNIDSGNYIQTQCDSLCEIRPKPLDII